jgi:hypothetical protein
LRAAAVTLDENPNDIPFALVYLLADDGRTAWLAETVRLENGSAAAPDEIELNSEGDVWRFRQVLETGQSQMIENLDDKFGQLFAREWGSAFTVTIPLGKSHLPADRIGAARSLVSTGLRGEAYVEEALRWLPEEDGATGRLAPRNAMRLKTRFRPVAPSPRRPIPKFCWPMTTPTCVSTRAGCSAGCTKSRPSATAWRL